MPTRRHDHGTLRLVTGQLAVVPHAEVRIGIGEPIGSGIRRVALGEFDRAVAALSGHDLTEGIHTARKALKRLRALLVLLGGRPGKKRTRTLDEGLRHLGRSLAEARDADVLLATLDSLAAEPDGALVDLRAALLAERDAAFGRTIGNRAFRSGVLAALAEARLAWSDGELAETLAGIPDDLGAVEAGLTRTHRRGRRRMARALSRGSEQDFHQWRKAVKALRYQLETLSTAWPEVIGGLAATADELGEILGAEHDLAALEALVTLRPDVVRDGRLLTRLTGPARRRLQEEARPLGSALYAEEPEVFAGRMCAYWAAHQRAIRDSPASAVG